MARLSLKIKKGEEKMKKILAFVLLASLIMCLPAAAATEFKDMASDHWAAPYVYDLVKKGVTGGFPDGTFRGNEKLSRYETAVFLSKLAKSLEKGGATTAPVGSSGVSGTIFVNFSKGLTNSSTINNFDISRAYLTFKSAVGENANAKVVLDSGRVSSTRLDTFVKYAFVDLTDIPTFIPGVTKTVRIGMQPTYWSPWVDGLLGLRVVASSMVGMGDESNITTSDFGVGGLGTITMGDMPKVNYLVTVLNGSSFAAAENNKGKNIAARVNSEVLPGVTVAAGGQIEDVGSASTGEKLGNVLVGYNNDMLKSYLEVAYGKGALGYSAAGLVDLGALESMLDKYGVFARVDIYDGDRTASNNALTRVIGGATYDYNSQVKLVADLTSTTYGSAASTNAGQTVTSMALRTQINL
ncbi:MAG: S-layer homology domain-containing protein [bacterium]